MRIFLIVTISLIVLYVGSFHLLVLARGYSVLQGSATGDDASVVRVQRTYPRGGMYGGMDRWTWPAYRPLALLEERLSGRRALPASAWANAWRTVRTAHWRHFSHRDQDQTGDRILYADLALLPPATDEGSRVLSSSWIVEEAGGWWIDLTDAGAVWCYQLDGAGITLMGLK